jgi:hypothetical protein
MTLETQYKNFKTKNPESNLTFDEWKSEIFKKMINTLESMSDDKDLTDWEEK